MRNKANELFDEADNRLAHTAEAVPMRERADRPDGGMSTYVQDLFSVASTGLPRDAAPNVPRDAPRPASPDVERDVPFERGARVAKRTRPAPGAFDERKLCKLPRSERKHPVRMSKTATSMHSYIGRVYAVPGEHWNVPNVTYLATVISENAVNVELKSNDDDRTWFDTKKNVDKWTRFYHTPMAEERLVRLRMRGGTPVPIV